MTFNDLTPDAQERYATVNKRLGLAHDTVTHGSVKMEKGKTFVFSSDPLESDVPPHLVAVANIQHLKEMIGNKDGWATRKDFDFPEYPDKALLAKFENAKSINDLKRSLTRAEHDLLLEMAVVYVNLDSTWANQYVPMINTLFFPRQVAFFAALEDLNINTPVVIKGSNPVVWNYNNVNIQPGGSINAQTQFALTCTNFDVSQSGLEAGAGDYQLGAVPSNQTPATNGADANAAGPAGKGGPGTAGAYSYNSSTCTNYCSTQPGNGQPGAKGTDGGNGSNGAPGTVQSSVTASTGTITGNLIINCGGGNGQTGGNGGHGQDGGPGGDPGPMDGANVCTPAKTGPQGPGGNGGKGGDAGPGGNGGILTLTYQALNGNIQYFQTGGQPGNAGQGGVQGNGNPPGNQLGNGATALPGTPSQVFINGQPAPPSGIA